jgi:hypothetical protein
LAAKEATASVSVFFLFDYFNTARRLCIKAAANKV